MIWRYGIGVARTLIEGEMKSQSTLGQKEPYIAALNWSALSDYGGTVVRGVRICCGMCRRLVPQQQTVPMHSIDALPGEPIVRLFALA